MDKSYRRVNWQMKSENGSNKLDISSKDDLRNIAEYISKNSKRYAG